MSQIGKRRTNHNQAFCYRNITITIVVVAAVLGEDCCISAAVLASLYSEFCVI